VARKLFLFLIIIVSSAQVYSQPRLFFRGTVESNLFQTSKDSFSLFISFRIPYSELIFSKDDSHFNSGAQFSCEVYEKDSSIFRKSTEDLVTVSSYDETLNPDKYIQAVLQFRIGKAQYIIKPQIERNNTDMPIPQHEITLDLLNNEKRLRPVVVEKLEKNDSYILVNRGNIIPYDERIYSLLVPVTDPPGDCRIRIEQKNNLLLEVPLNEKTEGGYSIQKGIDNLTLQFLPAKGVSNVIYALVVLPDSIDEGDLQIIVESGKKKVLYNMPVVWLEKPMILSDLDAAVQLLKIIADGKRVDYISSQSSEMEYTLLKKEWNKIVKPEKGPLNMLMKEFYTRADYAMINFSFNGQRNGAFSDRGKIYIQFGKPDKIEREYNSKNENTEIWYYASVKREFIFEDTTGKGNYLLRK